jgi:arginine-tRNA-protein transferase
MHTHSVRLFQTAEHPCGYFPQRLARDLVLDPTDALLPQLYAGALEAGFRRSGGHVYRPRCAACDACRPLRIDCSAFRANRSQRRNLARNADLELAIVPLEHRAEVCALYHRYVAARHPDGGMDKGSDADFEAFTQCAWSPTQAFEFRLRGQLVALAISDVVQDALSAVYTFYDPALSERGLGTHAILRQIAWARSRRLQHLYLGFWIEGHPKMDYKSRFAGAECFRRGHWLPLGEALRDDPGGSSQRRALAREPSA